MENELIIKKEELLESVKKMAAQKFRFSTATCLDLQDKFEIIYSFEPQAAVIPLQHFRVSFAKDEVLPSISDIYPCALISENEMSGDFNLNISGMALDYHKKLLNTQTGRLFPLLKMPPVVDKK